MSKPKQGIVLLSIVTIVIGGTFLLFLTQEHSADIRDSAENGTLANSAKSFEQREYAPPKLPGTYEEQGWILVHNKKYGYSYYQPNSMNPNYFRVEIFAGDAEEKNLDVFVQEIFDLNRSDDNPYIDDESITEPREVLVNGTKAYEMVINGVFDSADRGFIVEQPSRFLFMDSPNRAKLLVYYPVDTRPNNIYEQIIETMRINETLIPLKKEPSLWIAVSKEYYKILFPSNLFKVEEDSVGNELYLTSIEEDVYGNISVGIEDYTFDPNNIQGMYGQVEDAKKVTVQERDWYQYTWGDGGCGAYIYETAHSETKTIEVTFSTCFGEDVYPIVEDETLQLKILETITFI